MKKHFLLLLLMTLLPLAGWSANIAVQLSTSLEKVYGSADPTTLTTAQFVIISDGGSGVTEDQIAQYLTFKRKPGNTGESVGTYDWEVSVSPSYTANTIVVTNTGRISITPLDLSRSENLSADLTGSPFTYDGNAKEPTVTNVTADGSNLDPSDYTISYDDNVDAGTAKVIITAASGNVTGSNLITFSIEQRTLAQNDLTIDDIPSVPFNASYWKPELNIKLPWKRVQTIQWPILTIPTRVLQLQPLHCKVTTKMMALLKRTSLSQNMICPTMQTMQARFRLLVIVVWFMMEKLKPLLLLLS